MRYHLWKRRLSDALFLTTESLGNSQDSSKNMATIDAHGYVIYCILCCFSPAVRVGVNVFHRDTYGIRRGVLVARSDELGNPRASVVERAAVVSTSFIIYAKCLVRGYRCQWRPDGNGGNESLGK